MFFSRISERIPAKNKGRKKKKSGKKRNRKRSVFGGKDSFRKKSKADAARKLQLVVTVLLLALCLSGIRKNLIGGIWGTEQVSNDSSKNGDTAENGEMLAAEEGACGRPEITVDLLPENPYSRSGIALKKVNGIVVHYVANPGSTAKENRDYFANLKNTHTTKASSHFIVGLDGEIIQCIPRDEISYASNNRNSDTISIECCHPKENGKFNKKTYASLVQLTAWLCDTYGLSAEDVIRHYDVTGKQCPKYYVEHEEAWKEFREAVQKRLEEQE